MSSHLLKIKSKFAPAGDQPKAIKELTEGLEKGLRYQTLLGVTGSGKTFTAANVIEKFQKPTLVIAHNKTLAAQLASEYREFFPDNAVHYFVSYYDFYQPEAYMPVTDTFIEKEAQINKEIERLRHASTEALLSRKDVIIVASVSCIYGLGSPEEYEKVNLKIEKGQKITRREILHRLVEIHFERTNADLAPGLFRAVGNAIEIMPVSEEVIYRVEINEDGIVGVIQKIDSITRRIQGQLENFFLFPAKHFITAPEDKDRAFKGIKKELEAQLKSFDKEGKILEADRLKRRTKYDLAMIKEIGYCSGIENYSRHFSGKAPGEPPDTLLSYFPHDEKGQPDFLTIIDESHVTIPQIGGMYAGDQSRKNTLVEHGFRLPSAKDNRPLKFGEFERRIGPVIFTSATPADYERKVSEKVVEQVIRPTGLIDPEVEVRPVLGANRRLTQTQRRPALTEDDEEAQKKYGGQIADFVMEAEKVIKKGFRAMATTLTKKMAEDLSQYLKDKTIKAEYLHSDIETLDRITILSDFRKGKFDVLVGVNLLREGLDLPEVSFIGILDADKEGFLRSETSLIQIIGRAARNVEGKVILYADKITGSMERAISETNRRRKIQTEYNTKHNITPQTIIKKVKDITDEIKRERHDAVSRLVSLDREVAGKNLPALIKEKEKQMSQAVKILDFESAALLRDEIAALKKG